MDMFEAEMTYTEFEKQSMRDFFEGVVWLCDVVFTLFFVRHVCVCVCVCILCACIYVCVHIYIHIYLFQICLLCFASQQCVARYVYMCVCARAK